jgi:hypothetical protein
VATPGRLNRRPYSFCSNPTAGPARRLGIRVSLVLAAVDIDILRCTIRAIFESEQHW